MQTLLVDEVHLLLDLIWGSHFGQLLQEWNALRQNLNWSWTWTVSHLLFLLPVSPLTPFAHAVFSAGMSFLYSLPPLVYQNPTLLLRFSWNVSSSMETSLAPCWALCSPSLCLSGLLLHGVSTSWEVLFIFADGSEPFATKSYLSLVAEAVSFSPTYPLQSP